MTDKRSRRGPKADYSGLSGAALELAKAIGDTPQARAARELGVTPAFFNHLIRGRKVPGRELAIRIRDKYGIPIDSW